MSFRSVLDCGRFQAVGAHIMVRLGEAAAADLRARYDVGWVVRLIRNEAVGGEAVRHLARRFSLDESNLRRYARVVDIISVDDFEWIVELRSPRGSPLTWSHIEILQQVGGRSRRNELARQAAEREWTVRELAARAHGV